MNDTVINILHIEDDVILFDMVRQYFQKNALQFQIELANKLSFGLDRLAAGGIDLVLLDLGMPDSQGLETLKKVVTAFPDIPIIVLTGSDDRGLWSEAIQGGAQDLLVKGRTNYDSLIRAIDLALERQRLQLAYREKVSELAASEARLQRIVDNNADGMVVVGEDGIIRFVNPAACALWGLRSDELVGTPFGHPVVAGEAAEIDLMRHGKTIAVEMRSTGITWKDEKSLLISIRDISQRKQMELEKTDMEARLRQAQKLEAIGTLAGGIAHDFNNILTPIMGFSQLALDDLPQEHPGRTKLGHVVKAARRAKEMVHQILAFSRQSSQEFRPVFLAPVIKEPLKLLRATIPTTIEIRQNIQSPDGQVIGDATQIHQVVMNLCTNAAHAMRDKGGLMEVSLVEVEIGEEETARNPELKPGPYLKLTVSDTGQGMKPETMKRIFEPYFTTKTTGEGTGMGLAVVHGIVASHGGAITVESEVDRGSIFDVYLPRLAAKVEEEVQETEPLPGHKERILFVDDEELVAELGRETLQRLEYQVTVLTDSLAALEAFRADPEGFDLVLTDQSMPHLNGLDLAREILKIRSDIPVIMYTGLVEETVEEKAKAVGIRAVLAKPPDANRLAEIIRGQLRKRG